MQNTNNKIQINENTTNNTKMITFLKLTNTRRRLDDTNKIPKY